MEVKFELNHLKKTSLVLKKNINHNVVLICGEMGAGKTTLIKELLSLMSVVDNVSSPTFSIINEYSTDIFSKSNGVFLTDKEYWPGSWCSCSFLLENTVGCVSAIIIIT